MKITGAIFDFNGTLLFDSEFHNQAWRDLIFSLTNKELTIVEMNTKVHGVPNVEAIENLLPNKFSQAKKEELSKLKEQYYRDICLKQENLSLVSGAIETFDYFKENNIPFTIASASIIENIDFFYETFNLGKWINKENIIYDDGTYIDKVEMFNDALEKINTDKENCLIFEDSLSGVKNAIKAGFKKIIILHYKDYDERFNQYKEVKFHSNNFVDILNFIKENDSF